MINAFALASGVLAAEGVCHVYGASGRWDADVGGRGGWECGDRQAPPRSTCTFDENIFDFAHDVQKAGS